MTDNNKDEIKSLIEMQLRDIRKQIDKLNEQMAPIAPDCSLGRLTRMEAMNEQEVIQKILNETILRETRLRNALSRIDSEMFGVCIECDEEIGFERMKIRPESVKCVDCANKT